MSSADEIRASALFSQCPHYQQMDLSNIRVEKSSRDISFKSLKKETILSLLNYSQKDWTLQNRLVKLVVILALLYQKQWSFILNDLTVDELVTIDEERELINIIIEKNKSFLIINPQEEDPEPHPNSTFVVKYIFFYFLLKITDILSNKKHYNEINSVHVKEKVMDSNQKFSKIHSQVNLNYLKQNSNNEFIISPFLVDHDHPDSVGTSICHANFKIIDRREVEKFDYLVFDNFNTINDVEDYEIDFQQIFDDVSNVIDTDTTNLVCPEEFTTSRLIKLSKSVENEDSTGNNFIIDLNINTTHVEDANQLTNNLGINSAAEIHTKRMASLPKSIIELFIKIGIDQFNHNIMNGNLQDNNSESDTSGQEDQEFGNHDIADDDDDWFNDKGDDIPFDMAALTFYEWILTLFGNIKEDPIEIFQILILALYTCGQIPKTSCEIILGCFSGIVTTEIGINRTQSSIINRNGITKNKNIFKECREIYNASYSNYKEIEDIEKFNEVIDATVFNRSSSRRDKSKLDHDNEFNIQNSEAIDEKLDVNEAFAEEFLNNKLKKLKIIYSEARPSEKFCSNLIDALTKLKLLYKIYICCHCSNGTNYVSLDKVFETLIGDTWVCKCCHKENTITSKSNSFTSLSPRVYIMFMMHSKKLSHIINQSHQEIHRNTRVNSNEFINFQNANFVQRIKSLEKQFVFGVDHVSGVGLTNDRNHYEADALELSLLGEWDGVLIGSSSNGSNSFWPLSFRCLELNELSTRYIINSTIFPSFKKTTFSEYHELNINQFIAPIMDDINKADLLGTMVFDGSVQKFKKIYLKVIGFTGDAPATSKLTGTLGSTATNGCLDCLCYRPIHNGNDTVDLTKYVKEKGYKEVFEDADLLNDFKKYVLDNTSSGFWTGEENIMQLPKLKDGAYRTYVYELLQNFPDPSLLTKYVGYSGLSKIFWGSNAINELKVNIPNSMHCFLENLSKKLISLIFKVNNSYLVYKRYALQNKKLVLDIGLILNKNMKSWPLSFGEQIRIANLKGDSFCKAEQISSIVILMNGIFKLNMFQNCLDPEIIKLFEELQFMLKIGFSKKVKFFEIKIFEERIQQFVKRYESLFSKDQHPSISITRSSYVHSLLHIPMAIDEYGPLGLFTGYRIERNMGDFKRGNFARSNKSTALTRKDLVLKNVVDMMILQLEDDEDMVYVIENTSISDEEEEDDGEDEEDEEEAAAAADDDHDDHDNIRSSSGVDRNSIGDDDLEPEPESIDPIANPDIHITHDVTSSADEYKKLKILRNYLKLKMLNKTQKFDDLDFEFTNKFKKRKISDFQKFENLLKDDSMNDKKKMINENADELKAKILKDINNTEYYEKKSNNILDTFHFPNEKSRFSKYLRELESANTIPPTVFYKHTKKQYDIDCSIGTSVQCIDSMTIHNFSIGNTIISKQNDKKIHDHFENSKFKRNPKKNSVVIIAASNNENNQDHLESSYEIGQIVDIFNIQRVSRDGSKKIKTMALINSIKTLCVKDHQNDNILSFKSQLDHQKNIQTTYKLIDSKSIKSLVFQCEIGEEIFFFLKSAIFDFKHLFTTYSV
ncbi:hypothetical protein BN7_4431 [Wickerhamomyces ciferrii]|uniref:Uncharacterized protein n=1 Tax=Wickerhamomyces ciferrii (strain ATCC 14091 / BCRC 22168 / CBS 111 / JCM 3599 / NBRC 0793 / NRRL Y-1031 F-60-10) TaxID=1206466 RepID=K0KS86_WICCF|nr:uncharacterized protein BN7_4431 [Wickerhamomyces ciferrii]CCH44862.1 hypothetical protein BN7_4431 [Wickerhamomyces ciferrii]